MKNSISCNCQFTHMKGNSNVLSANLMELLPIRIPIHIMFVQVQMADDGWLHCQSLPVTATMVQLAVANRTAQSDGQGRQFLNAQIDPNRIQYIYQPTSPFQSNCDWKLKPRDWKINQNTWMSARWCVLSLSIPFLSLLPSGFQVFAMLTLAPCEGINKVQSLTQAGVASAIPHESS